MKTLLLWLEGPLQSWGCGSLFYRRATMPFPTKSGILGMICAAMGRQGEQRELLALFAPLKLSIVSFGKEGQDISILTDFHMVGSNYDDKDPWELRCIPKTYDGKKAVGGGTKLTHRQYLQNAKFAVIVEIPDGIENELTDGFCSPVFDICLGRKNCPPADIVFRGIFETQTMALAAAFSIAEEKGLTKLFSVEDGYSEEYETIDISDVPICFGVRKEYASRTVHIVM